MSESNHNTNYEIEACIYKLEKILDEIFTIKRKLYEFKINRNLPLDLGYSNWKMPPVTYGPDTACGSVTK